MIRVRILHEYLLRRDLIVQAKTLAKGKRLVRPRSNTYRDYLKYDCGKASVCDRMRPTRTEEFKCVMCVAMRSTNLKYCAEIS
jgi:hypothetical protein